MQTLGAVGAQEGSVRLLVVPGLLGITRLHCRDDVHQTGMIATRRQDLGDDRLLADMAFGDVLDRYPGGSKTCHSNRHQRRVPRGGLYIDGGVA